MTLTSLFHIWSWIGFQIAIWFQSESYSLSHSQAGGNILQLAVILKALEIGFVVKIAQLSVHTI